MYECIKNKLQVKYRNNGCGFICSQLNDFKGSNFNIQNEKKKTMHFTYSVEYKLVKLRFVYSSSFFWINRVLCYLYGHLAIALTVLLSQLIVQDFHNVINLFLKHSSLQCLLMFVMSKYILQTKK